MFEMETPYTLQDIMNINNKSTSIFTGINTNSTWDVYAPQFPYTGNDLKYSSTNDVENITCDSNDDGTFLTTSLFQTIVYFMYTWIFLVAFIGNGIVCFIVKSCQSMRTVTNFFIANLAVGDILMSLFCVPFSFVPTLILTYWPFGTVLCHLVNYTQATSVLVSAYTLVAISVDRYIVIMWPLRPRITKRFVFLYFIFTLQLNNCFFFQTRQVYNCCSLGNSFNNSFTNSNSFTIGSTQ